MPVLPLPSLAASLSLSSCSVLVPEADFEVTADVKMAGAPRKAREHVAARKPRLLTGIRAKVVGPLDKMQPAELELLLAAAGATVIKDRHGDGDSAASDSDSDSDSGAGSRTRSQRAGGHRGRTTAAARRRGSSASSSSSSSSSAAAGAANVITISSVAQLASEAKALEAEKAHAVGGGPVVDQTWVLDSISAWAVQPTAPYGLSAMLRAKAEARVVAGKSSAGAGTGSAKKAKAMKGGTGSGGAK